MTASAFLLVRIMRLSKANIAGLTSPLQQSEMKSILAGTWPPLKPLPIFKYETAKYRATIDFDKKRGEWVCRKTSLPSNDVQELRGGLREITIALPHGETEVSTDGAEQQEQELEKDTNRRLQAIRDWRENYENGARYFELRDYLSESQRTEIDDSLRLSLTARQLQFNPKNVAYVFDALSIAGGRFAALIEFAKRNKVKQGTAPQAQGEEAVPEAEPAMDLDKQSAGINSHESGSALNNLNNDDPSVRDHPAAEHCTDADEFPALSIKNVFPEQDQASLAERLAYTPSQQLESETSEIVDVGPDANSDFSSPAEHPHQQGHHSPAFSGLAPQVSTAQSSKHRIEASFSRFPIFEISAFQVAALALLFLFAVIAFTVGLTLGRGSLGKGLREAPKSMLASDAKSPALPDQTDGPSSRTPTPPAASPADSAGANRLHDATPLEEKPKERTQSQEYFAGRPTDSAPSPTTESEPLKTAAPHLPTPSTMLVAVPSRGQPFRLSSPKKAVAATSSFAMTSQLSVLVPPESAAAAAHQPARLQAGELVSFVWPRYARPGTISVRATIGQLGQVQEVKFLSGSVSLLPATMRAIRQWQYTPTLLDKRPVQAQQDVTIEFRPPHYSSRVSTHHSSHN